MRMINRLLKAELVSRRDNPGDRREDLLALTADSREIVDTVTRRRRAEINRIVAAMPTPHRAELVTALHAFADVAGEPEAQAASLVLQVVELRLRGSQPTGSCTPAPFADLGGSRPDRRAA